MSRLFHFVLASTLAFPVCIGGLGTAQPGDARRTDSVSTITGKERLGRKWSDEQRVDDCHVPQEYRTRERPENCSDQAADVSKPNGNATATKPAMDQ